MVIRYLYTTPLLSRVSRIIAKTVFVSRVPGGHLLLPRNPLFCREHYAASNPDIKNNRDTWAHYIAFGADEGRNPHPLFDTRFYLAANPDVASSGLNPLVHYVAFGAAEGRQPHPGFDPAYYLLKRPDVKQSGMNPLLHYWRHGRSEGAHPLRPRTVSASGSARNQRFGDGVKAISRSQSSVYQLMASQKPEPSFSILLPVFNIQPQYLRCAVESVFRQTYRRWQLCIYDDGSSNVATLEVLKEIASLPDPRIVVKFGSRNLGIAAASNMALALAEGDYTCMLDHDDELESDALQEVAHRIAEDPLLDVIYTDQDFIDANGRTIGTLLKPDWSPEMFRGVMYVNHLLVVRSEVIRRVGGFDSEFDKIQDFEFMLRVSEKTSRIAHVRRILYHWRAIPGSIASGAASKGTLEPLQAKAVNQHLSRCRIRAVAAPHDTIPHRLVIRSLERTAYPMVYIAIKEVSGSSAVDCARFIVERSSYPNIRICVMAHSTASNKSTVESNFDEICPRLDIDNYLVCIDSDLRVLSRDWLQTLLMYCEQVDVACAAPLILTGDKVWCSGLVLGMGSGIGYPMRGLPAHAEGYAGSLCCAREVSAVSGECLMISGSLFHDLGGRIKYYSGSAFEGADLALRALTTRRRNIVTPQAVLQKIAGPVPAVTALDEGLFNDRWREVIGRGDPFYNPTFSLEPPGYTLATASAANSL